MWYWIVLGFLILAAGLALVGIGVRWSFRFHQQQMRAREEAEKRILENREKVLRRLESRRRHPAAGSVEAELDERKEEEKDMTAEHEALMLQKMEFMESCFVKYGAVPQDINQRNREILSQRQSFLYQGNYYRVDHAEFDNIPFLMINSIDDPKFAAVGVMEDVEAIPVTLSNEKLEKEVRYALGIEPYPENYPDW